jgi:catalase-peroxidase
VLTDKVGTLSTDFFVNLLAPGAEWKVSESDENVFEIRDAANGDLKWTATAADLVFGANSQLRSLAEVYASADAQDKFVTDFVAAWTKVMELDRFDLRTA